MLREHGGRWKLRGPIWRGLNSTASNPLAKPEFPELDIAGVDDLFYIPPVEPAFRPLCEDLVERLHAAGTPALVQLRPGEHWKAPGTTVVYDLLDALLTENLEVLESLPAGSAVVWPLIAGVSDSVERFDEACRALVARRVTAIYPLTVELSPQVRRRLAEGKDEEIFDLLFHGALPEERAFARRAESYGLTVFSPRPTTVGTPRQKSNRGLAADLALAGEVWLRLGRPEGAGQALLRAARGAESTPYDLKALAREGNLGVLDWLDQASHQLVKDAVLEGEPRCSKSSWTSTSSGDCPCECTRG